MGDNQGRTETALAGGERGCEIAVFPYLTTSTCQYTASGVGTPPQFEIDVVQPCESYHSKGNVHCGAKNPKEKTPIKENGRFERAHTSGRSLTPISLSRLFRVVRFLICKMLFAARSPIPTSRSRRFSQSCTIIWAHVAGWRPSDLRKSSKRFLGWICIYTSCTKSLKSRRRVYI